MTVMNANENENEIINGVPEELVLRVAAECEPTVFDPKFEQNMSADPEYGQAYVDYHRDRVKREAREWLERVYPEIRRYVLEHLDDRPGRLSRADFMTLVRQNQDRFPSWRYGQVVFNLAAELAYTYPVAERLRGSDKDPFYRDENVPAFLDEIFGADT